MGMMFLFTIGLSFLALVSLAARAIVAVWIYKDAERRGMNSLLWCLLIVFTSVIIVLLVYLFVKKPSFEPKKGLGLLITGCVMTGISFVLSIFVIIGFFGMFGMMMDGFDDGYNYDYDMHDNMFDDYDYDYDDEYDF
ncbi:peptidase [Listeria goaensis]|uniref:peptidase n=1 Tax=Listeria goaensis TaxID=1649188 RepID=UPI000B58C15F|nr:peptidase [Listeria goaensis]